MNEPRNNVEQQTIGAASGRRWVSLICLAVVVLACGLAFYLRYDLRFGRDYLFYGDAATSMPVSDANTWLIHGMNVAAGRGFGDYLKGFRSHNYIPPGHPFFLAFLISYLGEDPARLGWAIALLGSLLPLFAYLLTREMWGRGPGCVAALLAAVHRPFVCVSFSLMSEASAILFTALALWLWARLFRTRSLPGAAAAGLVFGFAGLVRPTAFVAALVLAPLLLVGRGVSRSRRVGVLIAFLIGFALLPGAWQVRNRVVHGEASALYSTISARHVWTGANPKYRPSFYSRRAWHETLWRAPDANEVERVRTMREETAAWVRGQPVPFLMSCIWRMRMLNWEQNKDMDDIPWTPAGLGYVQTSAMFVFALVGMLMALRAASVSQGRRGIARIPGGVWAGGFAMTLVLLTIGAGVYGASGRYRWPLEYYFIPFAALSLYVFFNMGRIDIAALGERWVDGGVWPRAVAWARVLLPGLVAVLIAGAAVRIQLRHGRGGAEPLAADTVPWERVEDALDASGLAEAFEAQRPRRISYARVFEQQRRSFGRVTSLNNAVVVWWGRVLLPHFDASGRFVKGYLVVEPEAGDFGGARLGLRPAYGTAARLSALQPNAVVTVIARIRYVDAWTKRPDLEVYAALPGRVGDGGGPGQPAGVP